MSNKERKLLRASGAAGKNICGAASGEGRNVGTTTTLSTGNSMKFKEPSHWNYQVPTLSMLVVSMGRDHSVWEMTELRGWCGVIKGWEEKCGSRN